VSVESDVAGHLASALAGPPWGVTADDVRPGPVRPVSKNTSVPGAIPSRCIFVVPTGGFVSIPFVDGGAKGEEERPTVQIVVRSPPRDYDTGRELAQGAYEAINLKPPAGYFEARAFSGGPSYLREDEQNHHEWIINVGLRRSTV
jgi:hypothetical protein